MEETRIWQDIERIALATGRREEDVYSELMDEFAEMVAQRLDESYDTGRPKLKINEAEFVRLYKSEMPINDHLPKRRFMIKYDKKEFKRLFSQRVPYENMAKILGMSENTVMQTRKRLGLSPRNHRKV